MPRSQRGKEMKRYKFDVDGFIEKSDLNEFIVLIRESPIYKTPAGVERSLRGYECLRIGKVQVKVIWTEKA